MRARSASTASPSRSATRPRPSDLGIAVIYQEFNLTPNQTVAENVFLRDPQRRGGLLGRLNVVDKAARRQATRELLEQVGSAVDPDTKVSELSVAHQQLTEIAKALALNARILIMDEPTSTLPDDEVDTLFGIVEQLQERGIAVVFVSHRLEETRRIADRVTVLRDGRNAGGRHGRRDDRPGDHQPHGRSGHRHALPEDGDRTGRDRPVGPGPGPQRASCKDISFDLRRGEVLGLSGLVGAGRTEIARCIFGADRYDSGTIDARRCSRSSSARPSRPCAWASATSPRTASARASSRR